MDKKGAAGILIVFIVGIVAAGGYFGYKAIEEGKEQGSFGYGLWDCSSDNFEIGPELPLGYGRANFTGSEKHELKHEGKVNLCCMDFVVDETKEKYKICEKRDSNGTATHKIVWQDEERLYEIVPWRNLSCLYDYRNQEDWARTCEEDSNLLFSSKISDGSENNKTEDQQKNDSYYFEKAIEQENGSYCEKVDSLALRGDCYKDLGCETGDASFCYILNRRLRNDQKTDSCLYCVYESTGNRELCEDISNNSLVAKCAGFNPDEVFSVSDLVCESNRTSFNLTLNKKMEVKISDIWISNMSIRLMTKMSPSDLDGKREFSEEGETREYIFHYESIEEDYEENGEKLVVEKIGISFYNQGKKYNTEFYC